MITRKTNRYRRPSTDDQPAAPAADLTVPEDLAPFWPSESIHELQFIAAATARHRRQDSLDRPPTIEQVQRWRHDFRLSTARQRKHAAEQAEISRAEDLARRTCPVCGEATIELTYPAAPPPAGSSVRRELVDLGHGPQLVSTYPIDEPMPHVALPPTPAEGQRVQLPSGQWVKACRACVPVLEGELAALAAAQTLPDGRTRGQAAQAFLGTAIGTTTTTGA